MNRVPEAARVREMQLIAALCPSFNRDRGPDEDRAWQMLERLADREWGVDDDSADRFVDAWFTGSGTDPWGFSDDVIRPLSAAWAILP